MNNGAYAGLRRAPRAAMPEPDDNDDELPEDDCTDGKKKDKNMDKTHTQDDVDTAAAQAASAATKAANERFNAVLASEHFAGREALGQKLLSNDKLSAEDIIDMLQAAEKKPEPEASDDGGNMLAQMREGADADLGTEGGDTTLQAENHGWGTAHARVAKMFGGAK